MKTRVVLLLMAAVLAGAGIALHNTGLDLGVWLMFLAGMAASGAYGLREKRPGQQAQDKRDN